MATLEVKKEIDFLKLSNSHHKANSEVICPTTSLSQVIQQLPLYCAGSILGSENLELVLLVYPDASIFLFRCSLSGNLSHWNEHGSN